MKTADRGAQSGYRVYILGFKTITGKISYFVSMYAKENRDNGFLRYWTVSNVPLFILAAPALYILMQSAIWGCSWHRMVDSILSRATKSSRSEEKIKESRSTSFTGTNIIRQISIPQAVLTILAFTNFHVQIITRISSGYPVWYWWLATTMIEDRDLQIFGRRWEPAKVTVRWMVIYAVLQGGLFASFLPPA